MKKIITTLAVVSMLAITGVAGAQTTAPGDTTGATEATTTNGTTGTGTPGVPETGASGTSTDDTTPGVPSTGAGGDATINYAILATSAAVAVVAAAYALRSRKTL
jgi:hypothetical protein